MKRIALYMNMEPGYGPAIVRGIASFAHPQMGWTFGYFPTVRNNPWAIREWHADAVVCCLDRPDDAYDIEALGIPAVNVGRYAPDTSIGYVANDDRAIGALAATHFLNRDLRHLAFVSHPETPLDHGRYIGFREAAERVGSCPLLYKMDESTLEVWLRSLPKPIGIFAHDDALAWRVVEGARQSGLRIPHEVAVLGVDNVDLIYTICQPPLSSIVVAAERIGFEAAAMLYRMLNGEAISSPVYLPPVGLVTRESSDIIAVDDDILSRAVQYIRENAADPIDVGTICRHIAVNRRSLERKFRHHLGRTPLDELRYARVERARVLLADTDLPMNEVAHLSGLTDARQLLQIFQRFTGQTPSVYRSRFRK